MMIKAFSNYSARCLQLIGLKDKLTTSLEIILERPKWTGLPPIIITLTFIILFLIYTFIKTNMNNKINTINIYYFV